LTEPCYYSGTSMLIPSLLQPREGFQSQGLLDTCPCRIFLLVWLANVPIMSNHHVVDFTDAGNKVNEQVGFSAHLSREFAYQIMMLFLTFQFYR
jgi:hypothetical protein